jgi:hypothetical protein
MARRREDGVVMAVQSAGVDTRPRKERRGRCTARVRAPEGGPEGKEKGARRGVGDGPRAAPHSGEAWGAWVQHRGRAAQCGRQRPGHGARGWRATGAEIGEGGG